MLKVKSQLGKIILPPPPASPQPAQHIQIQIHPLSLSLSLPEACGEWVSWWWLVVWSFVLSQTESDGQHHELALARAQTAARTF